MNNYTEVIKRLRKKSHSKEELPNGLTIKYVKRADYHEFQLARPGVTPPPAEVELFTSALAELNYTHITPERGITGRTIEKVFYGVAALRAVKGEK